jgi:membrane protease subunit (stomatin/prohibitin family)
MRSAAENPTAGPMMAFAGMNMAANAGGMNAQNLFAMGQAGQAAPAAPAAAPAVSVPEGEGWICACKAQAKGKFCGDCGQPQCTGWTCGCGVLNKGKFCSECGAKKPADEPLYQCDKCGWEPEDLRNPPKFCPECGDPFNEEDVK